MHHPEDAHRVEGVSEQDLPQVPFGYLRLSCHERRQTGRRAPGEMKGPYGLVEFGEREIRDEDERRRRRPGDQHRRDRPVR